MSSDLFTLFVVLPDESVCTLRNLSSGINIEEVKARLELTAGLPSHIYTLIYPDGEKLVDRQKLLMRENIKDGYILKVHIIESWDTLYNSVTKNNIESVYHNGVHFKGNMVIHVDESEKVENAVYDRGCVALYIASYLGLLRMCNMLISVGIDINGSTQFGRTALHAAAVKDNLIILKYLVDHGAKIYSTDLFKKTPLDVAQKFSSHMCEKSLKTMQLNLRGYSKLSKMPQVKCSLPIPTKMDFKNYKDKHQRPKSYVEERTNQKPSFQRPRPQTHHSPLLAARSSHGNKSVAWVSIQDADRRDNRVSIKAPGYYKFQTLAKMETLEEDVITCKPLPLLKKKSCLKFGSDPSDNTVSRSTQTTPAAQKQDVATTPMLFAPPSSRLDELMNADEMNTSFSVHERDMSARTRSSRSSRIVSFSPKERSVYPESSRVMKRRINLVVNRSAQKSNELRETSTPQRTGVIHDRWAERRKVSNRNVRAEISSSDDENSDEFDDDDSGNGSDVNMEAYEAWLKRKEQETKRTPKKITRPIHNIIKIGSTEVGDARNPPAEYNITAYKDWLERRKLNKRVPNLERIKSMKDFMAQKKMLEEKRQKLLMTAISYDEWMDHEFDRRTLIRKILQADFDQLKAMELEAAKSKPQTQSSHEKWEEEVMKREEREKKRREIQQNYTEEKEKWRKEIIRQSEPAVSNDLRVKNSQERTLLRSNSKGGPGSDVKRAADADRAYREWMKQKHADDVSDLQRQIQTEEEMIQSYRQRRGAQMLTC